MTFSGLFRPSILLFLLGSGKNLRSNLVLTIFFFFKFLPLSIALSDALPPWFSLLPLCGQFSSVQFSHSVITNSLWPHEHSTPRPPCPSPTPGVHPNPCPSSWFCHPTISSSEVPFSCPQYFPASRSFPLSRLFASGGQSIRVSASTSVLPMNIQDWFPLRWTGWISLQSKDSQESSPTPHFKSINSLVLSFLYSPALTSIHYCWKKHSFD